jgi:hypothetical protein
MPARLHQFSFSVRKMPAPRRAVRPRLVLDDRADPDRPEKVGPDRDRIVAAEMPSLPLQTLT